MTTKLPGSGRFFHLVLRTIDEPAARAFHAAVLGVDPARLIAFPLHEAALARGARPHWLGFLGVADVAAAVEAFAARGARPLGPSWVDPQGLEAAMVWDPGGALVALGRPPPGLVGQPFEVAWSVLHTPGVEAAKETYRQLFGWDFRAPEEVPGQGTYHPFAWHPGGPPVGSLGDLAGRPEVHPHWLHLVRVASLDAAVAEVAARGGRITARLTLPGGGRAAVGEDPQGAAFGLAG